MFPLLSLTTSQGSPWSTPSTWKRQEYQRLSKLKTVLIASLNFNPYHQQQLVEIFRPKQPQEPPIGMKGMEGSNSVFYKSRRENEIKKEMKSGSVFQDESLKRRDGDGEVRTTAAVLVTPSTVARAMEHMEHIVQRHMKPLKSKGKSYLLMLRLKPFPLTAHGVRPAPTLTHRPRSTPLVDL